ncbi:T6SS effector amidase Tae4 family protein [Pseudoduganella buxea]|uniref:Type VI secretion system amidase effector protein Tae4 n=1 Tax=Pseudoduganella buxea TaxID=1949069 RepID=A0A6I3SY97_9BURK|nr:T6SS effector amidase Tae4 family protein [Pseudoduganella buxea]MTV53546.1 hypothetical protein [Pseudoduganella buxea]GGC22996.1 hypothetical protein GCM10011572_50630 [Pseudoduganella buxea]
MTARLPSRVAKPSFATLAAAYPAKSMMLPALYTELGIEALIYDPAYQNTCAIRVSYALAKAGTPLRRGGLRINRGPHKGQRIEPGMKNLSEQLQDMWGPPERFDSSADAKTKLVMRQGVAAFFFNDLLPIVGAQGHIDLLYPRRPGFEECANTCFFGPYNKVWFWDLH